MPDAAGRRLVTNVRAVLSSAALLIALMALVVAAGAVTVLLGDLRDDVRNLLGLSIAHAAGTGSLVDVFLTNARIAGAALISAWAIPALDSRGARLLADGFLGLLLMVNCWVLGAAIAGYGAGLGLALLPHAGAELVGFALAGGAYVASRHRPLPTRVLLTTVLAAVAVLLLGALIETGRGGMRTP